MNMTPLPGDPGALAVKATRYQSIAATILAMSARLEQFASEVDGGRGNAVAALAERVETASADVAAVQPRYADTATALSTYAVQLRSAQDSAASAIAAADADRPSLVHQYNRLNAIAYDEMPYAQTTEQVEELRIRYRRIEAEIARLEGQIATAEQQYRRAVEYRDLVAQRAIDSIEPVLEKLNDTLRDHVDAWVESLPDFLQLVGRWIGDVLVDAMETFQSWADAFWAAVTFVATYIAMLFQVLANYPPEIWMLFLLSPGLALAIIPALTGYLAQRLARDVLKPTPAVEETARWTSGSGADVYAQSMADAARVDELGGVDRTVIEVVEVLDEDGRRVGWRVILPSTQDWQDGGWIVGQDNTDDLGALNDLDSNLALMLTPSQQAAYERAVYQAMLAAGVGPDDPVMLTGWSQGGILAGTLASDPKFPFNVQAIFVSGAPIDAMDIPDSVSVMSVQHIGDVVPLLDGPISAPPHSGPNWVTLLAEPPIDVETGRPYEQPHHPVAYTLTAGVVDQATLPRITAIKEQQAMFYSANERHIRYEAAEQ